MAKVDSSKIKKLMKDLRLTASDVEKKAGVSGAVLQALLAGKLTSPDDLRKVAGALRVEPDKLMTK